MRARTSRGSCGRKTVCCVDDDSAAGCGGGAAAATTFGFTVPADDGRGRVLDVDDGRRAPEAGRAAAAAAAAEPARCCVERVRGEAARAAGIRSKLLYGVNCRVPSAVGVKWTSGRALAGGL
eukprot:6070729-Prymnesium_polylepis.1